MAGGLELLEPLARLLARDHRVLSYQLRGEDDCFALRRRFDMRDLATDLAEFLEWHCLERPAICGVSFGGLLALEFAARFPNRIRALSVQGVGARFENSLLQRVAGMVLSRYPLPPDNPFVNQFFNLLFGARQQSNSLFHFVTRRCWQTDQGIMAHRFRLVRELDLTDRLAKIRVPSLLITGERDLLVSARSIEQLRKGLVNSRSVRVPAAGHLAFVTHASRVAAEIARFLKSA
jgi:pimeloyl-ACP methyl ester carboxylesterase